MSRFTSNSFNRPKDIYLPYRSTEQIIREAVEEHESRAMKHGWHYVAVSAVAVTGLILLNDVVLYFLKVL
jgi:hypothetical protein